MAIKQLTFNMKARRDDVSESYLLASAISSDGTHYDHEYVHDIMNLKVISDKETSSELNVGSLDKYLDIQQRDLEKEVQVRNSKYYDQQEEMIYRNHLDQKAASEARIREYQKKERDARQKARTEDDPLRQLEYKKDARKWALKAEEEDDRAREERKTNRERQDEHLELIEASLKGNKSFQDVFAISWEIVE